MLSENILNSLKNIRRINRLEYAIGFFAFCFVLAGGVGSLIHLLSRSPISKYWGYPVVFFIGLPILIICIIVRHHQEREAKIKAEIKSHEQRNRKNQKRMIVLGDESVSYFQALSEILKSAEYNLNKAETYYDDSAFAPFWDSIENAVKALGRFDECIRKIEANTSQYTKLTTEYEGNPPHFPLSHESVDRLKVGKETAKRMDLTVHKAQCNFQFAMIYEQRRTNQILVAGFTSFAQALDKMTHSITKSIGRLETSVNEMSSTLSESIQGIQSQIDEHSEITGDYLEAQAESQKRTLKKLDDINRNR